MAWMRSQTRRTYALPIAVVTGLVLVGMLLLYGSPLVATPIGGNVPQAVDFNPDPDIFETALVAMEAPVNLGNGVVATAQTLNGTIPGPEIRLKVGDKVVVHFTNNLPIPATIHWHGIELTNRSDGTGITQDSVLPGGTYTYYFSVPRPGVYFYHSHIAATNPTFKGYYGSLIVDDPAEQKLQALKVLPIPGNTLTMILGDTTVCKEPGANDAVTFPADPTGAVPWAGGDTFPGKNTAPSPKQLCETPLDEHGHFADTGPLSAGSIPNIQPTTDCGAPGEPGCPTNEGQLVLANGKVPTPRAGSPEAPGRFLARRPAVIDVKAGDGIRVQLINAATTRYFRLLLTDQTGAQITLFRVGGQGGLLDRVRVEGGTQGALNTDYDPGEILLPAGGREDVVFVPQGVKGDVITLWTLDYRRTGTQGGGSVGFAALPTVPVAHFRIIGEIRQSPLALGAGRRFAIADGDPLLLHPKSGSAPIENIKTEPITGHLIGFGPIRPNETLAFTVVGQLAIDRVDGSIFDEGAPPPVPFTSVPHISSSRFAEVGKLLELTIRNDTGTRHPWHPHGFLIQPVRFVDSSGVTLFAFPYNEFVDTVDIPPGAGLVYRVRLDDRPSDFETPTGGALGRWAMHCHIFFHSALGMITELVVVKH